MSYTPPAYNAVAFDFYTGAPYSAPGATAVNFDFTQTQTLTGFTAGDQALFGGTTAIPFNTIFPPGLDAAVVGGHRLLWDQFIRPSGAAYDQYGTLLLIPDQFLRGMTAGVLTLFGTPRVYNFTQYVQPPGIDGFGLLTGSPAFVDFAVRTVYMISSFVPPALDQGQAQYGLPIIGMDPQYFKAIGKDLAQYGVPRVSNQVRTITGVGGYDAAQFSATHWVSNFTRYLQPPGLDAAIAWDDFGPTTPPWGRAANVHSPDFTLVPHAVESTEWGVPSLARTISPAGFSATQFGTATV